MIHPDRVLTHLSDAELRIVVEDALPMSEIGAEWPAHVTYRACVTERFMCGKVTVDRTTDVNVRYDSRISPVRVLNPTLLRRSVPLG